MEHWGSDSGKDYPTRGMTAQFFHCLFCLRLGQSLAAPIKTCCRRDIWRAGPEGYGLLLAAAGGGALVGAFGLASYKRVPNQGAVMLVSGVIFFLLSFIFFALSPYFILD